MKPVDLDDRTPAVVTGQQAGLFGGPMYTLYKLLGAIALAADRGARPVFWIECDDADIAEVDQATVLEADGAPRVLTTGAPDDGRPVAARTFDARIEQALDQLAALLPEGEIAARARGVLRETHAPGTAWPQAFGSYLAHLTAPHPVEFIDPTAGAFKRRAATIVRRVLADGDAIEAALEAGARLLDPPQVAHRPGKLPLFVLDDDGRRRRLERHAAGFRLRDTATTLSRDATLLLLDQAPERFSAAVLLRPVLQDFVLPTVVYVAGPSELRYHAQLGPLYQLLGVRQPEVVPRPSFTLVEPRARRALERLGAEAALTVDGERALIDRALRDTPGPDPSTEAEAALAQIEHRLQELRTTLQPLDPKALGKAFDEAGAKIAWNLRKLGQKAADARAQRDSRAAHHARTATAYLRPGGKPQERVLCPIQYLARIEPGRLVEMLLARIDPKAPGEHQFVEV